MATRIQRKVAPTRRPARPGGGGSATRTAKVARKVPLKHLVRFTRLLATLVSAGLPVLRNLRILADQWPEGRFQAAIEDAGDAVEEGRQLSESLSDHPEIFDDLYINMARAGEAGGVLDKVLERLAEFLERSQAIRDKTRAALAYPMVILSVAVMVVVTLLLVVIPKFRVLFEEMDMKLPPITQGLIAVSNFMQEWWYLVLGIPTLLGILLRVLHLRSHGFRRFNHARLLGIPIVGRLSRLGQVSRFATTLGTLVSSGVPHLRSFEIVEGALTNELYREAVSDIHDEVREGVAIHEAMEETGLFDDIVVSMVEVGEETGELDRLCLRVDAYEEDFNRTLEVLFKVFEPVLLLVMAGLVGLIAMALFMPLFKILEQLGSM